MKCEGCGNEHAVRIKTYFDNLPGETKKTQMKEICDKCGVVSNTASKDVYFRKPYFDDNLGDEKHPYGQMIESKEHKHSVMREQGVHEAGDRIRGARMEYRKP